MVFYNSPMNHNRLILTCQHSKACPEGAEAKRHNCPLCPLLLHPGARWSFWYLSSWVQPSKTLVWVPSVWQLLSPARRKGHTGGSGGATSCALPHALLNSCVNASFTAGEGCAAERTEGKDLGRWCLKDHYDGVKGKYQERCSDPAASLHPSERVGASTVPVLICREQSCLGRERKR